MVKAYSIYETKTNLSAILRQVKSGKEVILNDRGRSVAKILPFKPLETLKDRWSWLCDSGRIIEAKDPDAKFTKRHPSKGALKRFLEER